MAQPWVDDAKFTLASISSSGSHPQPSLHAGPRHRNVFRLLALREISPCTKYSSKRFWQGTSKWRTDGFVPRCEIIDAKHALISWVEAESLWNLSAKYCPLLPPPRSTIAAAFSSDGKTLASTHGDHTVKIIDCQTGSCLKVLSGHRRTPWVVRFHPLHPQILASGSLDHEVRLWDAHTADCIGLHDFYRPIASIAFHSQGELLAVASGHKLFMWNYNNRRGEASSPTSVLKTKRSLRAVHFHPYAARLLLTAEVNGLDSPDYPLTLATTSGYLQYPPAVFFANVHASTHPDLEARVPFMPSPYLFWPTFVREGGRSLQQYSMFSGSVNWQQREESSQQKTFSNMGSQHDDLVTSMEVYPREPSGSNLATEIAVDNSLLTGMEVTTGDFGTESMVTDLLYMHNVEALVTSSAAATTLGHLRDAGRNASRHRSRSRLMVSTDSGEGAASLNAQIGEVESQSNSSSIQSEFSTSLAAAATAELPCTVKLRIWSHDIQDPCASLDAERCLLTIPHAVLCSEMGAHFSPCGRFLAACVACVLPHLEGDPGLQMHPDVSGAATSPTRHPLSGHQVMYELRIYSLEAATFGLVLASSAIRAAHCLTSIQFSPTSEHLLLAYGRRHGSLLRSIVIDGETAVHTYTIMEVYRVSDMELVRVLPSAEDEVNVACFHPLVGGGLVYGTKEGKLRIFQCDGPRGADCMGPNFLFEENMLEYFTELQSTFGTCRARVSRVQLWFHKRFFNLLYGMEGLREAMGVTLVSETP